ncbi:hypothetical protein FSP39_005154 [Pinctada imbricata]|uniref:Uncharacterized protein n=1 Tax=Pinctada imbricata TaxID=66713 RepID=A0AA88XEN2_PINIB|nr:hypothetical protein FSP39_005154 [Pinctada imbricata]
MNVTFQSHLLRMIYLDETGSELKTYMSFDVYWTDELLQWNTTDYAGIENIQVSVDDIWLPDLVLANGLGEHNDLPSQQSVLNIHHTGGVSWAPGGPLKTYCDVDISKYPFDTQTCDLFVKPSMLDSTIQVLRPSAKKPDPLDHFTPDSQWDVVDASQHFQTIRKQRGLEEIHFKLMLILRRRTLYYILNMISPVVLLAFLSVCCFIIPPSCGEKMTLCISIFLTFAVYITIITEEMPRSTIGISRFGLFLTSQLILSALAIVLNSVVLHVYHKEEEVCGCAFLKAKKRGNLVYMSNADRSSETIISNDSSKSTDDKCSPNKLLANKLDRFFMIMFLLLNIISFVVFASFF